MEKSQKTHLFFLELSKIMAQQKTSDVAGVPPHPCQVLSCGDVVCKGPLGLMTILRNWSRSQILLRTDKNTHTEIMHLCWTEGLPLRSNQSMFYYNFSWWELRTTMRRFWQVQLDTTLGKHGKLMVRRSCHRTPDFPDGRSIRSRT